MQIDAIQPGAAILVVDDVLVDGGTALAAATLAQRQSGRPVQGFAFVTELNAVGVRERIQRTAGPNVQVVVAVPHW